MNIALLGYGKMGREIEKAALERGHTIVLKVNTGNAQTITNSDLQRADVGIEFSTPQTVVSNIYRCLEASLPVVVGTTGWYQQFEEIMEASALKNGTIFHATNFSLGVNLFFRLNSTLAKLMNQYPEYEVSMEEIHHVHKLDKPSGTAITLAEQIISQVDRKKQWSLSDKSPDTIAIKDIREGEVPGDVYKRQLQSKPAVSHYRLAIHLMSAFTLFAFTFLFALRLIYPKAQVQANQGRTLGPATTLLFIVLIIQIVYGAFTAGYVEGDQSKIRPGQIFNTWPKMGDEWMPEQVTMKGSFYLDFFENASGIQFMHRTIAIVVVALVCFVWYRSNKIQLSRPQYLGITCLIYGVTLQFVLGVLTLLYHVPVLLGVLHQTGAFFLFATCIYLLFHVFRKPAPAIAA